MSTKNSFYFIDLPQHNDERGKMCVVEELKDVPFKISRIFYDYDNVSGDNTRGNHANRNSQFGFVALAGSCKIHVDDGFNKADFVLDSPNRMLIIKNMVWKEMSEYSENCVLLVISDSNYDGSEYIRNYEDFIKERNKTK